MVIPPITDASREQCREIGHHWYENRCFLCGFVRSEVEAVMEGGDPMAGMEVVEVYFDPKKHTRDQVKEIVRRRLDAATEGVAQEAEGFRQVYGGLLWRTGTIAFLNNEIEGLDRQGFRELLRQKLQALGDEMLKAWEEENGGAED